MRYEEILKVVKIFKWNSLMLKIVVNYNKIDTVTFFFGTNPFFLVLFQLIHGTSLG